MEMKYKLLHCKSLVESIQSLCSDVINLKEAPCWHEFYDVRAEEASNPNEVRDLLNQYAVSFPEALFKYLSIKGARVGALDSAMPIAQTAEQRQLVQKFHLAVKNWLSS